MLETSFELIQNLLLAGFTTTVFYVSYSTLHIYTGEFELLYKCLERYISHEFIIKEEIFSLKEILECIFCFQNEKIFLIATFY